MKELELERKLCDDSYYLRNIDWIKASHKISDRKMEQIRRTQDELFKKHEFLKKYRKAKEKINETYYSTNN